MAYVINLPQVGASVTEGVIGRWLKKQGDPVEKFEPLVEVVTDKVTMEVPSPVKGVLGRIVAQEGQTVPMGAPIAEIETEEAPAPVTAAAPSAPAPVSAPAPASPAPGQRRYATEFLKEARPVGPTGGDSVIEAPEQEAAPAGNGTRGHYSPVVMKLAQEHNLDLSQVKGTGLGGRVTKQDVLKHLERATSSVAAAPAPPTTPSAAPAQSAPAQAAPAAQAGPDEEALPLSPIRKTIADNMARSMREIPHAWTMMEADVTDLVKLREKVKEEFARREGAPLTYLPFVIKAVTESLREHPLLNASWGGDKIIVKRRLHIGIAVAAPSGLVVPVIHNADRLSIAGLAHAVHDLSERAKANRLRVEDMQGGTFSVNNTGALGSVVSFPIIPYPQAAILTTEAVQQRLVVKGDTLAVRSVMNLCLSFDHRIADGLQVAAFLNAVKKRVEAMGADTPLW